MSKHPFQARSRGLYKMSRISFIWPLPSSQRNFIDLEYISHGIIMTISIITQVIKEIIALSLAENSVIFRCNHLRRREDGSVENAECGMWKVRSVENFNFPFQFQFSISIPGETRRNSVLTIIKKTR